MLSLLLPMSSCCFAILLFLCNGNGSMQFVLQHQDNAKGGSLFNRWHKFIQSTYNLTWTISLYFTFYYHFYFFVFKQKCFLITFKIVHVPKTNNQPKIIVISFNIYYTRKVKKKNKRMRSDGKETFIDANNFKISTTDW